MAEAVDPEDVVLPALLRASRGAYSHAVRARLHRAGFRDMPRNGSFVLGGIVNQGGSAGGLLRELGLSAERGRDLVDTLVSRGYLERAEPIERARPGAVRVTERGRAAAAAVRDGVTSVDRELADAITPAEMQGLRAGLIALCDIRDRYEDAREAGAE